jgi:hypothetical protein
MTYEEIEPHVNRLIAEFEAENEALGTTPG